MGGVLRMYRGAEMCTVDWDGYLLYGMNSTYEHHPPPQTLIPRFTIPSTETRVTANIPKPNAQYQSICPQIPALVFSNHKPPFTLHTLLQNQEKTGPTPRIRAEPALPCPALPPHYPSCSTSPNVVFSRSTSVLDGCTDGKTGCRKSGYEVGGWSAGWR